MLILFCFENKEWSIFGLFWRKACSMFWDVAVKSRDRVVTREIMRLATSKMIAQQRENVKSKINYFLGRTAPSFSRFCFGFGLFRTVILYFDFFRNNTGEFYLDFVNFFKFGCNS